MFRSTKIFLLTAIACGITLECRAVSLREVSTCTTAECRALLSLDGQSLVKALLAFSVADPDEFTTDQDQGHLAGTLGPAQVSGIDSGPAVVACIDPFPVQRAYRLYILNCTYRL